MCVTDWVASWTSHFFIEYYFHLKENLTNHTDLGFGRQVIANKQSKPVTSRENSWWVFLPKIKFKFSSEHQILGKKLYQSSWVWQYPNTKSLFWLISGVINKYNVSIFYNEIHQHLEDLNNSSKSVFSRGNAWYYKIIQRKELFKILDRPMNYCSRAWKLHWYDVRFHITTTL